MVTAVEAEAGRAMAESVVKQLSGGDTVAARFLYHEIFEFVPEFKLFLATNHKPIIRGSDHGIWRRIRLIPFEITIPPDERDRELPAKLKAESAGILAWIVRGCLAWQRDGLREPEAVLVATENYRTEMDVMGDFLAARCVLSVTASISSGELYASYKLWCEDSGDDGPAATELSGCGLPSVGSRRRRAMESRSGSASDWLPPSAPRAARTGRVDQGRTTSPLTAIAPGRMGRMGGKRTGNPGRRRSRGSFPARPHPPHAPQPAPSSMPGIHRRKPSLRCCPPWRRTPWRPVCRSSLPANNQNW